jgi:signal transduction histidine kinase
MARLRDLSIRQKLLWIGLVSGGTALAAASAAFIAYDVHHFRQRLVDRLAMAAQLIAAYSTAAVTFHDERVATAGLSALRARPQVVGAAIYDTAGQVLASYSRPDTAFTPPPAPRLGSEEHRFEADGLVLFRPILSEKLPIGAVVIRSDLSELRERVRQFARIALGVSILSLGVSLLISARSHASIAGPIRDLANVARAVSERQDYSLRAAVRGHDELGSLTETFNEMLGRIQMHDAQLQEAQRGLERRVEERTRELTGLNREMEAFSYSVSHDLRAPLRHIHGFVNMLRIRVAGTLDAKSAHYVDVIAEGASQMGHLIDDLLGFSRMSRAEMLATRVDLDALLQEVLPEVQRGAEGREIEWKTEPLPVVRGDRALLRVVLVNLLANAVKYTRTSEHARVEVGALPGEDGHVVLCVRDNGVGFDMEYVDKLFGVFQRLHRSEEFEGTGIGLATVRRIVERHGGRAWAVGAVGQGAAFHVSLPRWRA